jgi:hypothetical protein
MQIALLILAVLGIAAVLRHLATALSRLLRRGLDAFVAGRVADVRAHHGDITGLTDATSARALARRERRNAIAVVGLWIGLLVVPPFTAWPELLYAAYNFLWLVPSRRRPR